MNFIPQAISAGAGFLKGGGLAALLTPKNLSLGASALSAFSQYSAGLADKRDLEAQAAQETLGAQQEILRGKQSENEILDRLLDVVAQQRVAFASAGNDPFFGTPAAVTADTVRRGEQAGRTVQADAFNAWSARRQNAAALRKRGKASGLASLVGGVGSLIEGVAAFKRTG